MTPVNPTAGPAAEAQAKVRMLATVGPTPTDKNVYHYDSEWTFPLSRAEQLVDAGEAELLSITDAPAAPADAEPTEE
jgi:hypothetical protein